MAIAGDDDLRLGGESAFEDPIVRVVTENGEGTLRGHDLGDLPDDLEHLADPLIGPIEFGTERVGGLRKNGHGSEQLEFALDRRHVGFLGPSAGNGERRNEDIGVKNDPHDQRFW